MKALFLLNNKIYAVHVRKHFFTLNQRKCNLFVKSCNQLAGNAIYIVTSDSKAVAIYNTRYIRPRNYSTHTYTHTVEDGRSARNILTVQRDLKEIVQLQHHKTQNFCETGQTKPKLTQSVTFDFGVF